MVPAALKPMSTFRLTPLTNEDDGLPSQARHDATSRGVTKRPPACSTHQSIILSLNVLRKSGSNGVSMGEGHTLFTRTPLRRGGPREVHGEHLHHLFGEGIGVTRQVASREPGQPAVPPLDLQELEDVLQVCRPLGAGDRRGVDDAAALPDLREQRLRELEQGEGVHLEHHVGREGVRDARVVEEHVDGAGDLADGGVDCGPVAEVRLDERAVRTRRLLDVEDGDVARTQLAEEIEQGSTDAGGAAGRDDALSRVVEIAHGCHSFGFWAGC